MADIGLASDRMERVTASSSRSGRRRRGRGAGCRRLTLTTTDNNTAAIAFYHRLGLARIAVRPDGVAASRRVKPSIPMHDEHGRAIAGEVDFELPL